MYKSPFIYIIVILSFLINSIGGVPVVQAELALPKPGAMVELSPVFNPPILKGIKVHPDNPFRFDFVLDQGQSRLTEEQLKEESGRMIRYFLASVTVPDKDLWVNLSPYEKNRIIPDSFGQTEMGRDLLAQDYLLKQVTSSLIYPEKETGRKFWTHVYHKAKQKFGTTNIPVNTFNKVWIIPDQAVIHEHAQAGTAYVTQSTLKVLLEEDYESLKKNAFEVQSFKGMSADNQTHTLGSDIVREIVIPQLIKEVNEGANFIKLRQIYRSLILAAWYKKKIKDSLFSRVYVDQNKVGGIRIDSLKDKQRIYEQYLEAFKKGVFNYVREDKDVLTQDVIPRKYFSGGVNAALIAPAIKVYELKGMPDGGLDNAMMVTANLIVADTDAYRGIFTEFGLGEILETRVLKADDNGRGKVRYIKSAKGEYVLKEYPFLLNERDLSFMEGLQRRLSQEDPSLKMLSLIATKTGAKQVVLGKKSYVLYPWGGKNLNQIGASIERKSMISARLLADFDGISQGLAAPPRRVSDNYLVSFSDPSALLKERLRLKDAVNEATRDQPTTARSLFVSNAYQSSLRRQIDHFADDLPFDLYASLGRGLVHGDFYGRNILMNPDGSPEALIDFDDARIENRLFDITHMITALFLDVYREEGRLSPDRMNDLIKTFLEQYILRLKAGRFLTDAEIRAFRGYLRGKILYEILLRAQMLTTTTPSAYLNSVAGDERFFNELRWLMEIAEMLETIDSLSLVRDAMENAANVSKFNPQYLEEFARLSREREKEPIAGRRDQLVIVPTHNRPKAIRALLESLVKELETFAFGKNDLEHRLVFAVIEDSTDEAVREQNRRTVQEFTAILRRLSPSYQVEYWDKTRQEDLIDDINARVYGSSWDIRELLGKGFAGVRNRGLLIAREHSRMRGSLNDTIVTWIDDDSQWGTTVTREDGTIESGVHAVNYFDKTQRAFAGNAAIVFGPSTRDSVNGVTYLNTPQRVMYAPKEPDQKRTAAGNNTSFLLNRIATPFAYMSLARGEDLFKNILDAGALPAGTSVVSTKTNPIDHYRSSERSGILQELENHFKGINRVKALSAVVANVLTVNGNPIQADKVFLGLDHIHQLTPVVLKQLSDPGRFLSFEQWKQSVRENYTYIRDALIRAGADTKRIDDEYKNAVDSNGQYEEFLRSLEEYIAHHYLWLRIWEEPLYTTQLGHPYKALGVVDPDQAWGQAALTYSSMKFGDPQQVDAIALQLVDRIRNDMRVNSWDEKELVILNPAGYGVPNAASLLAKRVSKHLGLPHMSVAKTIDGLRASQGRLAEWNLVENGRKLLDHKKALNGKKVLFIDDGVFKGTVMDAYIPYLESLGIKSINAYVVLKLVGEGEYEQIVDLQYLRRTGVPALAKILNQPKTVLTTRMVKYAMDLRSHQFDELLRSVNIEARFNLYFYAIEYFKGRYPQGFNKLKESIEADLSLTLPSAEELSQVTRDDFFEGMTDLFREYEYRVSASNFHEVIDKVKGLLKSRVQESIKAVIFDLDKTLFDSDGYYNAIREATIEALGLRLGLSLEIVQQRIDALRESLRQQGMRLRQHDIALEFGVSPEDLDQLIADRVDPQEYISDERRIKEQVMALKAEGKKVAILTDGPVRQAMNVLRVIGIAGHLDGVFTSGEMGYYKPEQKLFDAVLTRLGVTPQEAVMVGDSYDLDIKPAEALGMRTVLIKGPEDALGVQKAVASMSPGGIDLDPKKIVLQIHQQGSIKLHIDALMVEALKEASGLSIGSISIIPIIDLHRFLVGQ